MMRLLGVLVGSALAVVALVVFVGIPEFTTETSVAEEAVITLPMRPETVEPVAEVEVEPASQLAEELPEVPVAAEVQAEPPAESVAEQRPPIPAEPEAISTMQQWYAFWSPFRSEIAATGFVDQLQRVTGLDYRVVKVKPGVYEVAFAYESDDDITVNLSQISAATGLNLPES